MGCHVSNTEYLLIRSSLYQTVYLLFIVDHFEFEYGFSIFRSSFYLLFIHVSVISSINLHTGLWECDPWVVMNPWWNMD